MNIIGLIPARGGSKKLPGKNIKDLHGKPLISYTIDAALKSSMLDRVIVTTDDEAIASAALQYKAEVPFMRPAELASDTSPDRPVIIHAVEWLKENENYSVDAVALLRPTTPFKTAELIDSCIKKLNESDYSAIRTVTRSEGVFHPYWQLKSVDGYLQVFLDDVDLNKYYQRQLLPECYRVNGVVDLMKTDALMNGDTQYGDKIGFIELEESSAVDIDTEFDFNLCEYLMSVKKNT